MGRPQRQDGEDRTRSSKSPDRDDATVGSNQGHSRGVEALHRRAGNQAVKALHDAGELQASLAVSQPTDPAEREAEAVAETVVRGDESTAPVDVEHTPDSGGGRNPSTDDLDVDRMVRSATTGGRPLPSTTRDFFESRFGRDFGDVRVHTDDAAARAAAAIDAEAFTHGNDIVFNRGQYRPQSPGGKELLAHELTHVTQQGAAGPKGQESAEGTDSRVGVDVTARSLGEFRSVQRQESATAGESQKLTVGSEVWIQNQSRATFDGSPGIVAQIYFPTAVSTLDSGDKDVLDDLDQQLRDNAAAFSGFDSFTIRTKGYADGRGPEDENLVLASKRAATVANRIRALDTLSYLQNFDAFEGIHYEGVGEVGSASGDVGELAENRRVDVVLEAEQRTTSTEDEPTGKPPTPTAYEHVEGGTPKKLPEEITDGPKQPEGTWHHLTKDWWSNLGNLNSLIGPYLPQYGAYAVGGGALSLLGALYMEIQMAKILGEANNQTEIGDGTIGGSYGYMAAVMNPTSPRKAFFQAPDGVDETAFWNGAVGVADKVRSDILGLAKRVKENPDDTEAAKKLAGYAAVQEASPARKQKMLNKLYQHILSEQDMLHRSQQIYEGYTLHWPGPEITYGSQ